MYNRIFNPESGKIVSIYSKLGKQILKKYIILLKGGGSQGNNNPHSLNRGEEIKNIEQAKSLFNENHPDGPESEDAKIDVYLNSISDDKLLGDWRLYHGEWQVKDEKKILSIFDATDTSKYYNLEKNSEGKWIMRVPRDSEEGVDDEFVCTLIYQGMIFIK